MVSRQRELFCAQKKGKGRARFFREGRQKGGLKTPRNIWLRGRRAGFGGAHMGHDTHAPKKKTRGGAGPHRWRAGYTARPAGGGGRHLTRRAGEEGRAGGIFCAGREHLLPTHSKNAHHFVALFCKSGHGVCTSVCVRVELNTQRTRAVGGVEVCAKSR
jgi:hypothetical protein